MFRAVPCSSPGGQIVLLQPLVSSLSVNSRTVCRLRADCSLLSTGILYGFYSRSSKLYYNNNQYKAKKHETWTNPIICMISCHYCLIVTSITTSSSRSNHNIINRSKLKYIILRSSTGWRSYFIPTSILILQTPWSLYSYLTKIWYNLTHYLHGQKNIKLSSVSLEIWILHAVCVCEITFISMYAS